VFAYVGCYTSSDRDGHGTGISVFQVDPTSGVWTPAQVRTGVTNPSFLALDARQRAIVAA